MLITILEKLNYKIRITQKKDTQLHDKEINLASREGDLNASGGNIIRLRREILRSELGGN